MMSSTTMVVLFAHALAEGLGLSKDRADEHLRRIIPASASFDLDSEVFGTLLRSVCEFFACSVRLTFGGKEKMDFSPQRPRIIDVSCLPSLIVTEPGPAEESVASSKGAATSCDRGVGAHTKQLAFLKNSEEEARSGEQEAQSPSCPEPVSPITYSPVLSPISDAGDFEKELAEFFSSFSSSLPLQDDSRPFSNPEPPVEQGLVGNSGDQTYRPLVPSSGPPSDELPNHSPVDSSPPQLICEDVPKAYNRKYGVTQKRSVFKSHRRGGLRLKKGEKKIMSEELKHRENDLKIKERLALFKRNLELLSSVEHLILRMEDFLKHPLKLFVESLV